MNITANLVKELRERTGSGMMDCKVALEETNGDIELAIENLRKKGNAKADKKANAIAAEGLIITKIASDNKRGCIFEVNCQTDFVAKDENFTDFANLVALRALEENVEDITRLEQVSVDKNSKETLEERRRSLVVKLGENILLRRVKIVSSTGSIGAYLHGGRIGVLVDLSIDNKELGKDIAMHIAANQTKAIHEKDIPQSEIDKEQEIFEAQAQGSGKSPDIIQKMVKGRIEKFITESCLMGQPFVKDPSQTVRALLASHNAQVLSFIRFEVGEGIEKKVENFAEEVMSQVRGSDNA